MKKYSALLMAGVTGCSNMVYPDVDSPMVEVRQRLQNQIYYALFSDTDGDTVSDYWDQCLHTPRNVKVSTHGCPLDSNGDGIPDYQEEIFGNFTDLKADQPETEQTLANLMPDKTCLQTHEYRYVFRCYGFAYDSDQVTEHMRDEILDLVKEININQDVIALEAIGHTDARGSINYNLALSERRAETLAAELRQVLRPGIEVLVSGKGEFEPLTSNNSPEGRAINRRVEINALYKRQD